MHKRPCLIVTQVANLLLQRIPGWSFPTTVHRTSKDIIDKGILLAALKACSVTKLLDFGKEVHHSLLEHRGLQDQTLSNALVSMYGKCGSMLDARSVFYTMPFRDVVSWNSLIFGYAVNGEPGVSLQLLSAMEAEGHKPTSRTYVAVLVACSKLGEEETPKQVDGKLIKVNSLELSARIHWKATSSRCVDIYVATALINLYSVCGNMLEASRVFHRMPKYNVVSWSALIQGFAENGESELALEYFEAMQREALDLDARTYVAALVALTGLVEKFDGNMTLTNRWLSRGKALHSQITGHIDVFLASTLVNFYLKCGSLSDAKLVFDNMTHRDVALWNTLLLGYVENGEYELCLKLYSDMIHHCAPDARTVTAALLACGSLAAEEESSDVSGKLVKLKSLSKGMEVDAQARNSNLSDDFFVCSALVDMYSKCGSMEDARRVFERMDFHDVVSWTALILGYAETGESELALKLFERMKDGECAPNELTHVAALVACGNLVRLKNGVRIHGYTLRYGYGTAGTVGSSMVDFYAKCGSMDKAEQVFVSLENRSLVAWSALIGGYSRQGSTTTLGLVFQHLESMNEEGVKPNGVTMLSVLTACSHAGRVDKGRELLESMGERYGVKPEIDHYRCMVDALSRANRLVEAVELVGSMPYEGDALTWNTILGGCCKWKNVEIGKLALECMLKIDVNQPAAYVLMGNIYGSVGLWNERARVLCMGSSFMAEKRFSLTLK